MTYVTIFLFLVIIVSTSSRFTACKNILLIAKTFLTEQKRPIEFTYVPKPKEPKIQKEKVKKITKNKKEIVV